MRMAAGRASLRPLLGTFVVVIVLSVFGPVAGSDSGPPTERTEAVFQDMSAEVGLDFVHFNGMTGELYLVEEMGSGVALFDYDNDGDLDAYLVQGHLLGPGKTLQDAIFPPRHPDLLSDRLYRNDLVIRADGSRGLRLTDVTERSGLQAYGYGMGVAAADYDNDGWTDLYVTNFGSNQLWRNNGDGTFIDVTRDAGADDSRWSVPATFFDFDQDGWLDLFVGNYVNFTFASHRKCSMSTGAPDYCAPLAYKPTPDRLLHNLGNGTFQDVTRSAGIATDFGNALGVVSADFNGDGWIDLYVANDMVPNQLWINQQDGTFQDEGLLSGSSVNDEGRPEASMGVLAADVDGDGDEDLFMTHLHGETNTLYLNDGGGNFRDETRLSGLGGPSWNFTGFGTSWVDYDNDGWLDLITVNGAVTAIERLVRENDPYPLHEPNQLFRNLAGGRFEERTESAGPVFQLSEVSRGTASGDIDNDGDTDLLISNNSGPARLLVNRVGQERDWVGVRLLGGSGPRDMLGARSCVVGPGLPPLWRRLQVDGSYASASDPRVLTGLGDSPRFVTIRIVWPGGRAQDWTGIPIRTYSTFYDRSAGAQTADGPGRAERPQSPERRSRHPGFKIKESRLR